MIKTFFYILIFLSFVSCSNVDFIYKDNSNLVNPLYERTLVKTSGLDLNYINSYIPVLFGKNKDNDFELLINVEEKKIKRSVETNQAASNLRYELKFKYTLVLREQSCVAYKKEIYSNFSIIPKSAGFNFGTDTSLEKKYQSAITNNLNQFVSLLSVVNIDNCL